MAASRGRQPGGYYINSYDRLTLVSFVSRIAILRTHGSYLELANAGRWKGVGGLQSQLNRANHDVVSTVEWLVNRRAVPPEGEGSWEAWRLLAFYQSVVEPSADQTDSGPGAPGNTGLPAHYFVELANSGPSRSKPEVLVRGSALTEAMKVMTASSGKFTSRRYVSDPPLPSLAAGTVHDAVDETVADLCVVACHPPSGGGLEAARLIASTGTIAIETARVHILSGSPLSWRLLRVVTECLRHRNRRTLARSEDDPRHPRLVVKRAVALLAEIHESNPPCIYRARSLWEEAVGHLPKTNMDGVERFGEMLRQRALEGTTGNRGNESPLPIRERVTAAWTYVWRLARLHGWKPAAYMPLRKALGPETMREIADFVDALEGPEQHPLMQGAPRDRGLVYAAQFIRAALDDSVFWMPWEANETLGGAHWSSGWWHASPEYQMVERAIRRVQDDAEERRDLLPELLVPPAAGALVAQACLTVDGVSRRECLTSLQYAGLGGVASAMFSAVIDEARNAGAAEYRWLVENATFALGWMGKPERSVGRLSALARDEALDDSIRLTALMALGDMARNLRSLPDDCAEARRTARDVIEALPKTFTARRPSDGRTFERKSIVRSATYVLAMIRDREDLDLLQRVAVSPRFDESTTPAVAQWGVDRILLNELADLTWSGGTPSDSIVDQLGHQLVRSAPLRRLADPLASLRLVESRQQAKAKPKRR